MIQIRNATLADLDTLTEIEAECFPLAEAATKSSIKERLTVFSNHFWVAESEGKIIGFINGMVTDSKTIHDEMYEEATLHNDQSAYQSVFGLDILPAFRNQGYASQLMQHLINDAKLSGRSGCILTCKSHLIHYYEKFGYQNQGISASTHGHTTWYDMLLEF